MYQVTLSLTIGKIIRVVDIDQVRLRALELDPDAYGLALGQILFGSATVREHWDRVIASDGAQARRCGVNHGLPPLLRWPGRWRAALFDAGTALLFTYPGHTRDDYLAALTDAGLQVTRTVDATMGEAPPGTMLDEERTGGKEIPFCFVVLAMKPHRPPTDEAS